MSTRPLKAINRATIVMIGIGLAIAGGSSYYFVSQFGQKPAQTQSTPVIETITALGRIEPASEIVRVSTSSTLRNDRVNQLLVKRGDRLQRGQVIATLESSQRLQAVLAEAQEDVNVAQAKLEQVKSGAKSGEVAAQDAEIVRLEAALKGELNTQTAIIARRQFEANIARTDYNRYLELYREGAIATSELDRRRLTLETAQAQLNEVLANRNSTADSLRAQINRAKATLNQIKEIRPADLQAAQAEVDRAIAVVKKTQAELNEASIRTPIAGQVLEINTKSGEAIADMGIVDIGNTEQMEVIAEVYQSDVYKVQTGQSVLITGEGLAQELRGEVGYIGQLVSQQKVFSNQPGENLDRRVVEVRIRLSPDDSKRVINLTNLQVQVAIQL